MRDDRSRTWLLAASLVAVIAFPCHAAGQVLLDRTLAIVGNQVVTLADVRTARALALVDDESGPSEAGATERLIERALVLREVERYAPPEPPPDAVAARVAATRDRFASEAAFAQTLAAGGFTRVRLHAWIRDDLRIAAYLDQRFAAASSPTDQDVGAYYSARRDEFERQGLSFDEAAGVIRDRLAAERRRALIAAWIADLGRRTDVVRLPQPD